MFVFMACRAAKSTPLNVVEKTAFYTIKAIKDTIKNTTTFSVTTIQIAGTKINYKIDVNQSKNPYFLKIEIVDKNNTIINAFTEHPLFKRFDLYRESGEIESKSISLQQGEVVLRVPYFSDYKKMNITETVNFKQLKQVTITHEK
jgi:hypothetical protein